MKDHAPGIFESMKRMAVITDPHNEEQEIELTAIVRVLTIVLPEVPFVAQAEYPFETKTRLSIDVGNAVRAAIASAKAGA